MKKIIILIAVLVIMTVLVVIFVKKEAEKKIELGIYNGMTREEFKAKLEKAWKDRFFFTTRRSLEKPDSWAVEWHDAIEKTITEGEDRETAYLGAVQWNWAKSKPKANDNTWSQGWLSEIYVKETLGINPIPAEIRELLKEI